VHFKLSRWTKVHLDEFLITLAFINEGIFKGALAPTARCDNLKCPRLLIDFKQTQSDIWNNVLRNFSG